MSWLAALCAIVHRVAADDEVLELGGREVRLSSPGKVLFSERGETKRDLVEYYLRVGEPLLRTMGGRPVLMQRFPRGAGGPSFFQKRVPKNAPGWLETTTVMTVNGTPSRALVIADLAHVVWAVNLGCLGFHVWPYLAEVEDRKSTRLNSSHSQISYAVFCFNKKIENDA